MITASIQLPMRVAVQNRHRKPAGYHFRIEMRAGGRDDRNTLCGPGLPPIKNLPANPSAVSHALTPLGGGNWRRAIERTQTHVLALRRFIQPGTRWILNFCRALKAAGEPFLSLIKPLQKSLSVFRVLFRPNLSWLAAAHVVNSTSGAEKCPTKEFPKPENKFPRIA